MPVAPPANEIRFQRRTSSGSVMRPSSRGRPVTWGCIQSGPACASACQNGFAPLPARPAGAPVAAPPPARPAGPLRPGPDQVDGVPLLPRLVALARGDPGEAVALDLRGGAPLVAGAGRHVGQAGGDAVGRRRGGRGRARGWSPRASASGGRRCRCGSAASPARPGTAPAMRGGVDVLPPGDGVALPGPADARAACRTRRRSQSRKRSSGGRAVAVGSGGCCTRSRCRSRARPGWAR